MYKKHIKFFLFFAAYTQFCFVFSSRVISHLYCCYFCVRVIFLIFFLVFFIQINKISTFFRYSIVCEQRSYKYGAVKIWNEIKKICCESWDFCCVVMNMIETEELIWYSTHNINEEKSERKKFVRRTTMNNHLCSYKKNVFPYNMWKVFTGSYTRIWYERIYFWHELKIGQARDTIP